VPISAVFFTTGLGYYLYTYATHGQFTKIKMNAQPCIRGMRLIVRRVLQALATYPNRDAVTVTPTQIRIRHLPIKPPDNQAHRRLGHSHRLSNHACPGFSAVFWRLHSSPG
jgi:hypothetical protein